MSDRFTTALAGVSPVARFFPILLLLGLAGCGGGTAKSSFVTPPPVQTGLTGVSPPSGVVGESVSIFGSGFGSTQGSSTVSFNGTAASSVVTWDDGLITAIVPTGATSGPVVVSAGGSPFKAGTFTVTKPATSIAASNFGFQCGPGDTSDCEGPTKGVVVWPTPLPPGSTPGLLRLHDAGTQWANMDSGGGSYNFTYLDQWLDLLAAHPGVQASQVFTWVPCWDAPTCSSPATAPAGTNSPPSDLGAGPGGSSTAFNNFVTAFVQHCSPNGNCVKNLIHYYEMWNEWDLQYHWTGTMAQVYQMVAVPTQIIRQNDPNAVIMMPSATPDSDTGLGYLADFTNWLKYENDNGRISDWVDFHVYLTAQMNDQSSTNTPEVQWGLYNANYLTAQASIQGWQNVPWANTETNFNGAPPPGLNYTCPTLLYTPDDCTGQIVRWQLIHDSNGAAGLYWYKWNQTIGETAYEPVYAQMMQLLEGGQFTQPCVFTAGGGASTWTCPFKEANGTSALWVWTPNEAGTSYTPNGYSDYIDLTGAKTSVGGPITIGVMPFLLEQ